MCFRQLFNKQYLRNIERTQYNIDHVSVNHITRDHDKTVSNFYV